ncbi:hypothetical protein DFJ74DRAFT_313883 [Hyaloraphidium curvatum]|nr:hypothetical protein DFJ74DRAFT_313883 [Hyaloraphidium curvatum]
MVPDHVVIVTADLTACYAEWTKNGFIVSPQPQDPNSPIDVMNVYFADGTYISLVYWKQPGSGPWASGPGFQSFALLANNPDVNLTREWLATQSPALVYHGPYATDASKTVYPTTETSASQGLPYIVQYKDRAAVVPSTGAPVEHPNGATGIKDIQVVVNDVPATTAKYQVLAESAPIEQHGASARFQVGPSTVTVINAWSPALEERLKTKGEGVYALHLKSNTPLEAPLVMDGAEISLVAA